MRLLLFLVLIIAATAAIHRLETRGPDSLPPPQHNLVATRNIPVQANHRHLEHITLASPALGDIGFFISLPDPLPPGKLPIVIVLGGLGAGQDNVNHVGNAGNNAVAGLDWPIPVQMPNGLGLVKQLPGLYRHILATPGQGASMIGWLAAQPWADPHRISILGFSLGALAAPAIENLAARDGYPAGWTIIAYGGAPLGKLFAADPHIKPAWMREALGAVIDLLLRPAEPTVNLPFLSGRFLVLEGRSDSLIPEEARDTLRDAVPQPKDVVDFAGDHMGVGSFQLDLLGQIVAASRQWLLRYGAINP